MVVVVVVLSRAARGWLTTGREISVGMLAVGYWGVEWGTLERSGHSQGVWRARHPVGIYGAECAGILVHRHNGNSALGCEESGTGGIASIIH